MGIGRPFLSSRRKCHRRKPGDFSRHHLRGLTPGQRARRQLCFSFSAGRTAFGGTPSNEDPISPRLSGRLSSQFVVRDGARKLSCRHCDGMSAMIAPGSGPAGRRNSVWTAALRWRCRMARPLRRLEPTRRRTGMDRALNAPRRDEVSSTLSSGPLSHAAQ